MVRFKDQLELIWGHANKTRVSPEQLNPLPQTLLTAILLGIGFYFSAKFGHALKFKPDNIAVFWPPNTIVLTVLIFTSPRRWWIYFLAILPAYLLAASEAGFSEQRTLIFFIANCLEVLLPAIILRRISPQPLEFKKVADVGIFICVIVLASPMISASVASLTCLTEPVPYLLAWRVWFLGDSLAHLTITPFFLTLIASKSDWGKRIRVSRYIELGGLLVSITLISQFAFGNEGESYSKLPTLVYLPLPILLWAAFRFGPLGNSTAVLIFSIIAIWNAANGRGPFSTINTADNILSLQFFIAVVSGTMIFIATFISQYQQTIFVLNRAEKELEKHRTRLEELVTSRTKELKQSENRFKGYFDLPLIGIAITSQEKGWLNVNDKLCNILGYSREELIQMTWAEITHPDDLEKDVSNFKLVLFGGTEGYSIDKRFIKKNGQVIFASISVRAARNPSGKIDYFMALIQDISDRKLAEEMLIKSEQRFERSLEGSNDAFWEWDIGNDNVWWSSKFFQFLGYTDNAFKTTSDSFKKLLHPDDVDSTSEAIGNHLTDRVPFDVQYRLKTKSGDYLRFNVRGQGVWDDEGVPVFMSGSIQDITESTKNKLELEHYRSNLEDLIAKRTSELGNIYKKLLHAEKLSAIGKLSASIAHEVNNPICGIRNVLEGLYENAHLKDNENKKVQMAINECTRVANLIKNLNEFYRPSSGKASMEDINSLIKNMLYLSSNIILEMRITLVTEFASGLPKISIISDQIKQVLLNLLQNAQASIGDNREDGKITVTTESKNSKVIISVRDNGCGIAENMLDKIFDPFVSTKPEIKGVGLGLSISYGIVKAHGGEIKIDSAVGNGSTFSIILPVNSEALSIE